MTDAAFAIGDRVRILDRDPRVHHRVPDYAKGATGIVERVCGLHGRPERLIRGDGEPKVHLYRVRLELPSLWPDYSGPAQDRLDIEIFEHWLEPRE